MPEAVKLTVRGEEASEREKVKRSLSGPSSRTEEGETETETMGKSQSLLVTEISTGLMPLKFGSALTMAPVMI